MYRVPANLDLSDIVGAELEQIRLGPHEVQFQFGSGTTICVQSRVTVLRGDSTVSEWNDKSNWSNAAFQVLLARPVLRFSVPNDRVIEIQFAGELSIQLHDDSDQYESMQISRGDMANMVVI
jgi:hypothetical protein